MLACLHAARGFAVLGMEIMFTEAVQCNVCGHQGGATMTRDDLQAIASLSAKERETAATKPEACSVHHPSRGSLVIRQTAHLLPDYLCNGSRTPVCSKGFILVHFDALERRPPQGRTHCSCSLYGRESAAGALH